MFRLFNNNVKVKNSNFRISGTSASTSTISVSNFSLYNSDSLITSSIISDSPASISVTYRKSWLCFHNYLWS